MSTSILSPSSENTNPFDSQLTVDARHTGGMVTLDSEHIDWLGRDLVKVEIPGLALHLETYEARDLAAALQNLAAFIDEGVGL